MKTKHELLVIIDVFKDRRHQCRLTSTRKVADSGDARKVIKDLLHRADICDLIEIECMTPEELDQALMDFPLDERPF